MAEGLTPAKLYIYPEHTGVIQRISADKDYSLYVLWAMNDSADGERMPKTDVLTALKMKRCFMLCLRHPLTIVNTCWIAFGFSAHAYDYA